MLHSQNGNILNTNDYTYLLNKSQTINEKQTVALEIILQEFPYFQSARALYLKGLHNQESFRYNYELKKTAAYTADRDILFNFITDSEFKTLQKNQLDIQEEEIRQIEVAEVEIIKAQSETKPEITPIISEENSLVDKISSEEEKLKEKSIEETLEIGKPLQFENSEKHSFNEWLQLTQIKPIERENTTEKSVETKSNLDEKLNLIDKFIENNPKIPPVKENTPTPENIKKSNEEPTHLMTETLAKIYLEQKKYTRAIQAYEILILKYPEKSSFFANRIENIKKLQNNNN